MYKEISINYKNNLNHQDISTIKQFNNSFDENEVKIDYIDNKIKIMLKEIDINKLKNIIKEPSNNTNKDIYDDILKSIEGVKSYGLKGNKRKYVDYNKERKVTNRKEKELKRNQYYYAKDNQFSKTINSLPEKYTNKIIVGDSKQILSNIPDNSIDIIFTSPPYNFGLDYANNQDDEHWEDYFEKLFSIFKECIRVLKYGGRIIVNVQPLFSDYVPSHHLISNFFIKEKLIWKGEILWEKNNYNCKYTAWGSWKSPSNPYLKYTWEFIEVFCKGEMKKVGNKDDISISADEFKKWVVAKWSIAPERNMKKYDHPAMFLEELVDRVLKLFSYEGDIVLDPFNGVGTTTAVAKKLNRNYMGIDISSEYCKIAQERIKNIKGEVGLFADE